VVVVGVVGVVVVVVVPSVPTAIVTVDPFATWVPAAGL